MTHDRQAARRPRMHELLIGYCLTKRRGKRRKGPLSRWRGAAQMGGDRAGRTEGARKRLRRKRRGWQHDACRARTQCCGLQGRPRSCAIRHGADEKRTSSHLFIIHSPAIPQKKDKPRRGVRNEWLMMSEAFHCTVLAELCDGRIRRHWHRLTFHSDYGISTAGQDAIFGGHAMAVNRKTTASDRAVRCTGAAPRCMRSLHSCDQLQRTDLELAPLTRAAATTARCACCADSAPDEASGSSVGSVQGCRRRVGWRL